MNKNQHPNAAEALLNWTLTRADGRIVVQHSSGAFYAAAKEGDSGIAESILYMLADNLLSATLSPTHIEDGEEVEVVGYRSGTSGGIYAEGYGLERPEPLMTVAQHQRIVSRHDDANYNLDVLLKRLAALAGIEADNTNWFEVVGELEKRVAALSAPPAAGVPEGYVLAPIRPTIEMVEAGYEASLGQPDRSAHARVIEQYDAMLAEVPTPPASEQQPYECKCVYATASNTKSVRNGSEKGGYLKAECEACQQRRQSPPESEQQRAVVMPEKQVEYVGDRDHKQWAIGANWMLREFLRLNPHLAKGEGV